MAVQPVIAMWLATPKHRKHLQLMHVCAVGACSQRVTLGWVVYVFKDRVLGFARDNTAA